MLGGRGLRNGEILSKAKQCSLDPSGSVVHTHCVVRIWRIRFQAVLLRSGEGRGGADPPKGAKRSGGGAPERVQIHSIFCLAVRYNTTTLKHDAFYKCMSDTAGGSLAPSIHEKGIRSDTPNP